MRSSDSNQNIVDINQDLEALNALRLAYLRHIESLLGKINSEMEFAINFASETQAMTQIDIKDDPYVQELLEPFDKKIQELKWEVQQYELALHELENKIESYSHQHLQPQMQDNNNHHQWVYNSKNSGPRIKPELRDIATIRAVHHAIHIEKLSIKKVAEKFGLSLASFPKYIARFWHKEEDEPWTYEKLKAISIQDAESYFHSEYEKCIYDLPAPNLKTKKLREIHKAIIDTQTITSAAQRLGVETMSLQDFLLSMGLMGDIYLFEKTSYKKFYWFLKSKKTEQAGKDFFKDLYEKSYDELKSQTNFDASQNNNNNRSNSKSQNKDDHSRNVIYFNKKQPSSIFQATHADHVQSLAAEEADNSVEEPNLQMNTLN